MSESYSTLDGGVSGSAFQALSDTYTTFTALVDARINAILDKISSTAFVSSTPLTTSTLLTTYPASADNLGKYARVNDLYGSVDDIMRCRWDGVAYRWVPQRDNFNMTVATTGSVTLAPLFTPPTVKIGGTLTGAIQFVPTATNAYIGQRFRVVTGGLGVYLATVTGLIGSNLTLLGNSSKDIEYSASGWFAVSG